jgi:hypothetical protein
MKFQLLFILAFVLCLGLASAEIQTLGIRTQAQPINLVQNCLNSTYSNITRIVYPNSTNAINIQTAMTKNGDDYNYTFLNTNSLGQYLVYGQCDENLVKTNWVYDFWITPSGTELSVGQSILYTIGLIIAIVIFFLTLYASIVTPFKNGRDEHGKIISVNNLKWVKVGFIAITYFMLLFIVGLADGIFRNFLSVVGVNMFFNWLYYILLSLMYPLFVLGVVLMFVIYIVDYVAKKKLKRKYFR